MSAFAARFNIHRKYNYSKDDCESIRKYVKDKYSPALDGYISSLSDDDLISLVSSVETREIHQSVSSTRALYDLDLFLKDDSTTSLNKGSVVFKKPSERRQLTRLDNLNNYQNPTCQKFVKTVQASISNWCALDTEITINLGDELATPRELKQMFEECVDYLNNGDDSYFEILKTIIKAIAEVDKSATDTRRRAISYIVGDEMAKDFCSYYDTVSGTSLSMLEIKDLKDMSLFGDYLVQVTSSGNSVQPQVLRTRIVQVFSDIFNEFADTLSVAHYRHFFVTAMDFINTSDSRFQLLNMLVMDSNVDRLLQKAEGGDSTFVVSLIAKAGIPVKQDDIDNLNKTPSSPGAVYKTRFI